MSDSACLFAALLLFVGRFDGLAILMVGPRGDHFRRDFDSRDAGGN